MFAGTIRRNARERMIFAGDFPRDVIWDDDREKSKAAQEERETEREMEEVEVEVEGEEIRCWKHKLLDFQIHRTDRSSKHSLWTAVIQAANITRRSSSLGYNLKFVRGTISTSDRDRY